MGAVGFGHRLGWLLAVLLVVAFLLGTCQGVRGYRTEALKRSDGDSNPRPLARGVNGGTTCAVCTLLVSLAEQKAEIHNESIAHGLDRICSYLPDEFKSTCKTFIDLAVPVLIQMALDDYITPDVACNLLGFCHTDPGWPSCHLYPLPRAGVSMEGVLRKVRRNLPPSLLQNAHLGIDVDCAELPVFKELCEYIKKKYGDEHLPVLDIDGDYFSVMETVRGSYWRGRDCNDLSTNFHPGARPIDSDKSSDSNCNGIYGMDPQSNTPYEETLCSQTPSMGTILLGDSAGAHFHIPKEWLTATELSAEAFKDVLMIVENEIDWPMTSAVTGYMNSTWSVLTGPTDSLYLRLRELNHCNHRDFQNIGVNGADSSNMNRSVQQGLSRDQLRDHPALVIYSLIGNDVCNGHNDTIAHMTTPDDMKTNFLATLSYLDSVLPNGSQVVATGLADGRILYDTLKNRIHPIGEWRQDVTYPDVYNYLTCLQVSPCNGWMSDNATLRNLTSERAAQLGTVLKDVTSSYKPKNFGLHFIKFDFQAVVDKWKKMGGETWQLIEPVDGFHPSQNAMYIASDVLWQEIANSIPDVIKTWTNPNNARIKAIFGDQGGY